MTTPKPPTGVVLHTPTGDHPAELTYAGIRKDGIHVWHADTVLPLGAVLHITIDELPAKTIVEFPLRGDR